MIKNYQNFRLVFETDAEASSVIENLKAAINEDIRHDETAHIKLQYWVHYDEEGLAGFEITMVHLAHEKAYVNVEYICTAK